MIYTSMCKALHCRPAHIQTTAPTRYDVLMHLVYPLVAYDAKFISYGIAIAICSSSLFIEEKNPPKHLMFVCTICDLGTQSNV